MTQTSGRGLCEQCNKRLGEFSGAGVSMSGGGDLGDAVGTGIATGGYVGAYRAEAEASRERKAKLDATEGFWQRMKVRIIG